MTSGAGNFRPRALNPLAASLIGLCALAIVLASCGNATTPPTVGPPPTVANSLSTSATLATVGPTSPATANQTASPTAPATPIASAGGQSPGPPPSATSTFTLLKMATAADPSQAGPDPRTFTDTFPTSAAAVYVVFSLRPGLTGTVVCTMTANGSKFIQPLTIMYRSANSWGDFKVRPQVKFAAGTYQATLTYSPTGEIVKVNFTVK